MQDEKPELFLIGRLGKTGKKIVFIKEPAAAPFPGPFELHAVFTV